MIYEATIQFVAVDKNGNDKVMKAKYLIENCELFGEVESKMQEECAPPTDLDVVAINRSALKEIVNERPDNDLTCKIYFATIVDRFYDADKDKTAEQKYTVALFANDISEAHQATNQYMSQGLEYMELVGLKCTKFTDVIK